MYKEKEQDYVGRLEELVRLRALRTFELDYSELQEHFQMLTSLAAHITNSEISFVNLIDQFTQWSVGRTGIDLQQMPREESVCQYTITHEESGFEVEDLSSDRRFKDKFYVKDEPHLRHYFGVPLRTDEGVQIGALCVLDPKVRTLSAEQKALMKTLAEEVYSKLSLLQSNESLSQEVRSLKEEKAAVGHDIRNSISGIIGVADILERQVGNPVSNEEMMNMLSMIKECGNSIIDYADTIMDKSKELIQKERIDETKMGKLYLKLEKMYQPQAVVKNIRLIFECGHDINTTIPLNKLLQIVGNLIANSIKFTKQGGYVRITAESNDDDSSERTLVIKVADNGVGIDTDLMEKISNKISRTSRGTSGETGFGYGLIMVNEMVEELKGDLSIDSTPDLGSEFTLTFPD